MFESFLAKYLRRKFKKISEQLEAILRKEDEIMGAIDQLKTALDSLGESLTDVAGDVKRLQDQIAAGGTITEAQLQPLADKATAGAASLKQIADSVPEPTAPPSQPDPGP